MSDRIERCSICDAATGRAGIAEDSIYFLDGQLGPLCEECYHQLCDEILDDTGCECDDLRTKLAEADRWEQFAQATSEWQEATFGQATSVSKLHHLLEEVQELIDSQNDLEEWADVFMLVFGALKSSGISSEIALAACWAKLEKNKLRQWGEPDENGVVKHLSTDS